jgi:MFS family permease
VLGVSIFTGASFVCAVVPTVEMLIGARVVQGVGGALLTPGSMAMIESSFRAADRPRAIGAWSGLTGVASAVGPLLGGYPVSAFSWRAVFLLNLPIGRWSSRSRTTCRRLATRPHTGESISVAQRSARSDSQGSPMR